MKTQAILTAITGLALIASTAQANWVCNVTNDKEQQFTYSAPQEADAEKMAANICAENGIQKDSCDPDCFDTGSNDSRWHCAVANSKRESWSFTMLSKSKAMALAKKSCKENGITDKDCKPSCNVE